jgi:hypothetical protein
MQSGEADSEPEQAAAIGPNVVALIGSWPTLRFKSTK